MKRFQNRRKSLVCFNHLNLDLSGIRFVFAYFKQKKKTIIFCLKIDLFFFLEKQHSNIIFSWLSWCPLSFKLSDREFGKCIFSAPFSEKNRHFWDLHSFQSFLICNPKKLHNDTNKTKKNGEIYAVLKL